MTAETALQATLDRAAQAGWAGADPYDGLLSRLGRIAIPLGPLARMAVIQATLRFPQFRRLANPPHSVNPKGLGLFLGAVLRGRDTLGPRRALEVGGNLLDHLEGLATRRGRQIGWGYPFPWQSRFFYVPPRTANAVVTAMVGWHLLDWADHVGSTRARDLGQGAALCISEGLPHLPVGPDGAALAYVSGTAAKIVNVSALGARLLLRVGKAAAGGAGGAVTSADGERVISQAERLTRFVLSEQLGDGAWRYGVDARGRWLDSYHTGFILEALLCLRELGQRIPADAIDRGFVAYEAFFDEDGGARYSREPGAPYDAHSAAQGIVTYAARAGDGSEPRESRADASERVYRIAEWCLDRLWIPERGHFAHRIDRGRRDEQEYTRWVQAWMALALGTAIAHRARTERAGSLASR